MSRYLDPRFRLVASLIEDADHSAATRSIARQQAELIASQSGYSFAEAMFAAGIRLADKDDLGKPEAELASPVDDEDHVHATDIDAEGAPSVHEHGQIADALKADPSRSDRDIARECGASPTTVGRTRAALGLAKAVRTVIRGGKAYGMQIGARS